jgi:hypothetical protein
MNRASLERNPFFVLELPATATRLEVERAGQKLLGQLAIGSASAQSYATPFGAMPRDESAVRTALAALRDPERRVLHELWAQTLESEPASEASAWREAFDSIGWRGPCTD